MDNIQFEKLTPISDGDISVYNEALDFVFENEDVQNVAISGAYGAGKSSVLASYKKAHPILKFMHISLAHFNGINDSNGSDTDGKAAEPVKESVLEGKILNQLIHQIPTKSIPQTNFRIKETIRNGNAYWQAAYVVLLSLITIYILLWKQWCNAVSTIQTEWIKSILSFSTSEVTLFVICIIAVIIVFLLICKIINIQHNRAIIRKLNIQGNEIELFSETDDSFFDKYLNEVLYLFENVDADVIVFEDMDRFDSYQIFERLREINTLANIQRRKAGKHSIKFFYLLRDDIFFSKDRTKFFDCILPIVPVLDGSNSYEQLVGLLNKNNVRSLFKDRFLQGLSLYIDDMRLLKNICNEFLIYYNRLNNTELDCNKMLAIISYKNLFPRDFSELQMNRGFVYSLFANKERFIIEQQNSLNEELTSIRQLIQQSERELLQDEKELNELREYKRVLVNNTSSYSSERRKREQEFSAFDSEYNDRLQRIQAKQSTKRKELDKTIAEIERRIRELPEQKLSEIICRENIDSIFSLETENEIGQPQKFLEIKGSDYFPLLKFLIRNGYLDETYADYMTYFYEGSISKTDKIFLRSIADKKRKEYSYKLINPALIISHLTSLDFDQEEILNFDLFDYLLTQNQNSNLLRFVNQIREKKYFEFLSQFFDYTSKKNKLVSIVNSIWPEVFSDAVNEYGLRADQIREWSILTLYYSSKDDIIGINQSEALSKYVFRCPDYLNIENADIEKVVTGLKLLNGTFPELDYDVSNKDLFDAVYANDLYELNWNNIVLLLEKIYKETNSNDIVHRNLSLILQDPDAPLCKRIRREKTTYLEVYLQHCEGSICDEEAVLIDLFNDSEIDLDAKRSYAKLLTTQVEKIQSINDTSLWALLMENDVISYNENNIIAYFSVVKALDDSLIGFINAWPRPLNFQYIAQETADEIKEGLINASLKHEGIGLNRLREMVSTIDYQYNDFTIPGISHDKLGVLIEYGIIPMNIHTLLFIRSKYEESLLDYIEANIDQYVGIIDQSSYSRNELIMLLSSRISDEQKLNLLPLEKKPISIMDKDYSLPIRKHILENNLEQNDLPHLYRHYNEFEPEIQSILFECAKAEINSILGKDASIQFALVDQLIRCSDIDCSSRIKLMVKNMSLLDKDKVSDYLTVLGLGDFNRVFDSSTRPKYEDTSETRVILDAFISKGWIHDYIADTERPGYLRIHRTEPKKKKLLGSKE